MNQAIGWFGIWLSLFLVGGKTLPGRILRSASPTAAVAPNCSAPEYRQFDFWLGDWDAFENPNPVPVARNHVERVLDGCAVRETYDSADGMHGVSFSIYDASRKVWHQSWFTNRGVVLVIEGKLEGDAMVLGGTEQKPEGPALVRGIWKPVTGGVRETAVRSSDDGKTWKPWFDLVFRPHHK